MRRAHIANARRWCADEPRLWRERAKTTCRIARLAHCRGAGLMQSGQVSREVMRLPMHCVPPHNPGDDKKFLSVSV
jgi:hypothetical protein